jgi:hypothetical protein
MRLVSSHAFGHSQKKKSGQTTDTNKQKKSQQTLLQVIAVERRLRMRPVAEHATEHAQRRGCMLANELFARRLRRLG